MKNNRGREFKVIDTMGDTLKVEFIDTGYTTEVGKERAHAGVVMDRLTPLYSDLGCWGQTTMKGQQVAYHAWERWHLDKSLEVCDRWFNLSNLFNDLSEVDWNAPTQGREYNMPRGDVNDIYKAGKVRLARKDEDGGYISPETIEFVKKPDASTVPKGRALKKSYELIDPDVAVDYRGVTSILDGTIYRKWRDLVKSCYETEHRHFESNGGKWVGVSPRWWSYENFLEDIFVIEGFDFDKFLNNEIFTNRYIKQMHLSSDEHVYGPTTCVFTTKKRLMRDITSWKELHSRLDGSHTEKYYATWQTPKYGSISLYHYF